MKNKCFVNKIVDKDINYNKNYWIFFTAPLVLILAAIITFACCSFNFTFSFTGGKLITIDYSLTLTDEEYAQREEIVHNFIDELGIKNYTIERVGQEGAYNTVIKVITTNQKKLSNETIQNLKTKVTEAFGEDSPGFEFSTATSQPFAGNKVIIGFVVSLLVAMVLAFFYIWFRNNIASAVSAVIGMVFTSAMTCAFAIITRTPTDEYFIAVLLGVMIYTIIKATFKFATTEKELIYNDNKSISNSDLMNFVRKETFGVNSLMDLCLFLVLVVLMACGPNQIRFIALHLLFGLISCVYVNVAIFASAWVRIYNRRKDKRLLEKQKTTKNQEK